MHDDYTYALSFTRPDGSPVGSVPVVVVWEPALEWARFSAFRRRDLTPGPPGHDRVEPLWLDAVGAPYVSGFRVSTDADTGPVTGDLTTGYLADLVQPAMQALVAQGHAGSGETLRCHVVAFQRPVTPESSLPFTSEDASVPPTCRSTPLTPLLRASVAVGASDPDEALILIRPGAIAEAHRLAETAGPVETGGVLIGHLHRDPGRHDLFLEVTAQIAAPATGSSTTLTFTAETWTDVQTTLDRRHEDEIMLGWWHSHPVREWCKACPLDRRRSCSLRSGFLSADDRLLHRTVFPRAYSLALLLSDVEDEGITYRAFGWKHGRIQPRGFHLLDPRDAPRVAEASIALPTPTTDVIDTGDVTDTPTCRTRGCEKGTTR